MSIVDWTIGGIEAWQIRKPAIESSAGMVASQHFEASGVGARVLNATFNPTAAVLHWNHGFLDTFNHGT